MITVRKLNWFQRWKIKRKFRKAYPGIPKNTLFGYPIIETDMQLNDQKDFSITFGTLDDYDKSHDEDKTGGIA